MELHLSSHGDLEVAVFDGVEMPIERIRSAKVSFGLLHIDASPDEFHFLEVKRIGLAIRMATDQVAANEDLSPKDRSRLETTLEVMRTSVERFLLRDLNPKESHWGASGLQTSLEEPALRAMADRKDFVKLISEDCQWMEAANAARLKSAFGSVEDAFPIVGIERSECMRIARSTIGEVVTDLQGQECITAWLISGLLCLFTTGYYEQAEAHFARALGLLQGSKDYLAFLVHRYYSEALAIQEQFAEAYNHAAKALEIRSDPELLLDFARLAALTDRRTDAKRAIEAAILQRPLLIPRCLADPDLHAFMPSVLDGMDKLLNRVRSEAVQQMSLWNQSIARCDRVRKTGLVDFNIPLDLVAGGSDLRLRLAQSDLFDALAARNYAKRARLALEDEASESVRAEIRRRRTHVAKIRQAMEEAWRVREAVAERALAEQDRIVRMGRSALVVSMREGDKAEQGCAWATAMGCGTFSVYLVGAAILTIRGYETGLGTPFGMTAIALSCSPVVIALFMQISSAIKRITVEAQIRMDARRACDVYEKAVQEADRVYHEQIEGLREQLNAAEALLRQAEEAERLLAGTAQTGSESTRLPMTTEAA